MGLILTIGLDLFWLNKNWMDENALLSLVGYSQCAFKVLIRTYISFKKQLDFANCKIGKEKNGLNLAYNLGLFFTFFFGHQGKFFFHGGYEIIAV